MEIICTSKWINDNTYFLNELPRETKLFEVSRSVLEAALTTVNPDGVAAIISLGALPKTNNSFNFVLALDRLQDPGNLGNLFRTSLAADIETIWLASGVDPLNSKVIRASSGAIFRLPHFAAGLRFPSRASRFRLENASMVT